MATPTYRSAPSHHGGGPEIPPELAGLFFLALLGGLIAAIVAALSGDTTGRDIEQIHRDTATTGDIKREMEAAIGKADAHIQHMLEKYRGDRP